MTLATIDKCLQLLNAYNISELRDLLNYERQASILKSNGQKATLLTAVKKALIKRDDRPALATVQHAADGKPFICDGYFLVKWNVERHELDGLPQTPAGESIDCDRLIPVKHYLTEYELTDDDKTILKNIDKYIKLYPAKKGVFSAVKLFDCFFDAKLIKKVADIIGTDFKKVWLGRRYDQWHSVTMFEDGYTAMALPLNVNPTTKTEVEANTAAFLNAIKK